MEEYLSNYGWHFSKKMCDWAVKRMYRKEGGRKIPIEPISKELLDDIVRRHGTSLTNARGYDAVYVANMCKADFYGRAVRDEASLVQYVIDTINDPDGYDGMVFTRFYADCIGSGTPINWEDML